MRDKTWSCHLVRMTMLAVAFTVSYGYTGSAGPAGERRTDNFHDASAALDGLRDPDLPTTAKCLVMARKPMRDPRWACGSGFIIGALKPTQRHAERMLLGVWSKVTDGERAHYLPVICAL